MTRKEPKPGTFLIARDSHNAPAWFEAEDVLNFTEVDGTVTCYGKIMEDGKPRFVPRRDCFDTKADCRLAARAKIKRLAEEICSLLEHAPSVKSIRTGEHTSIYIKA